VFERRCVGPFAQSCLDEALGLSIGLGRVGLGSQMFDAKACASAGEVLCAIARAIVGHDAGDGDPERTIVVDGVVEEGDCTRRPLVGEDLSAGEAGMVVDRDVDELPSDPTFVGMTGAVTGDAVADLPEACQLLNVDVDDLARAFAFVARPARLLGFERAQAAESARLEDARDGGRGDAERGGDMRLGVALAAHHLDGIAS